METFSALLAICAGNSLASGEFLAQRPVVRSFDVFFDLHPVKCEIKLLIHSQTSMFVLGLSLFIHAWFKINSC